eukprot:jgi/Mesvir1/7844/Mv11778-RA.1
MTSWAVVPVCDVWYLEPQTQQEGETPEDFADSTGTLVSPHSPADAFMPRGCAYANLTRARTRVVCPAAGPTLQGQAGHRAEGGHQANAVGRGGARRIGRFCRCGQPTYAYHLKARCKVLKGAQESVTSAVGVLVVEEEILLQPRPQVAHKRMFLS